MQPVSIEALLAGIDSAPHLCFPDEKRPLGQRETVAIPNHAAETTPLRLKWSTSVEIGGPAYLRFTAATDARSPHQVHVACAASKQTVGTIDVLYACPGQVFELKLNAAQSANALRNGLTLDCGEATEPLWICSGNAPAANRPHLYPDHDAAADDTTFLKLFCSMSSLQPCDWMEACVLDGLRDWKLLGRSDAAEALDAHLTTFFKPDGRLVYENLLGHASDDRFSGVEGTGPTAVLAMEQPDHAALAKVVDHWNHFTKPAESAVHNGKMVAETSYSVAYPMMSLATRTGRDSLKARALQQLRGNRQHLVKDDDLWLRRVPGSEERSFKNWSRGIAWYYLGLVRTLGLLPPKERPHDLVEEACRLAHWLPEHQLPNGLWPCFLKEPEILPDSSGSAGIAAAVAIGVHEGILPQSSLELARRAHHGLQQKLLPGGWLHGTSQSNKRETHALDIQRHSFRVIAPWGMGLYAQLLAALAYPTARSTS